MNDRITPNLKVLGGKPCDKGTRIAVYMVLELVEAGISFNEIRSKFYPQLSEDIKACISYFTQESIRQTLVIVDRNKFRERR